MKAISFSLTWNRDLFVIEVTDIQLVARRIDYRGIGKVCCNVAYDSVGRIIDYRHNIMPSVRRVNQVCVFWEFIDTSAGSNFCLFC